MTRNDKVLVILLRIPGVGALFALVAVFIPTSWMVATHRWLGLGEMPTAPVVEYLARCLSAFYALFGALLLVVASDLKRYRPLVRFVAVGFVLLSVVFTGIDLAAGLPWWWTAFEGPPGIGFGALLYFWPGPIIEATPGAHDSESAERTIRQGALRRTTRRKSITAPPGFVLARISKV